LNPGKPDFFTLSFRNCISCVNNCEDLLYIYTCQCCIANGLKLYPVNELELSFLLSQYAVTSLSL